MKSHGIQFPLGEVRKLFWIDRFLEPRQCERVLHELEFALWRASGVTTYRPASGARSRTTPSRVSESAMEPWFTPQLRRLIGTIDRRIAPLVPEFAERREYWQST